MNKLNIFFRRSVRACGASVALARLAFDVLPLLGKCKHEELYAEIVTWLPGEPGISERRAFWGPKFARCGDGLVMLQGVYIYPLNRVTVGRNFLVAGNVMINAGGGFTAGDDVLIGPQTKIWTINQRFDDPAKPVREQGYEQKPVVIGNDVWIGAQCVILPGVTIGDHAVVGAGSVVSRDVPPWSIAVGNPARVVRSRDGSTAT
jgi:acetyltransferase-like isoleucine patch superfamily enzyme